jgi:hypothetical protein
VEEPDDGVAVDTMGSIEPDDVRRAFQGASPRLVQCYQQGLYRLRTLAGHVEFRLRLARDGSVLWAYLERSDLGDHAAQQCMLEVVRRLAFTPPRGGETETVFPIDLAPPDAVAFPPEWDAGELRDTVREHRLEIDACLGGSTGYALTLYLAPGGMVAATGATPPDAAHQDEADCLAAAARTWIVPEPGPGGAKATLEF